MDTETLTGNSDAFDYSALLASSVHDIKNSLNMLLNSVEVAMTSYGVNTDTDPVLFDRIQYEGKRLNDDLIGLLAVYRIQNQQYTPNIEEYCVRDFLEENLLQHQAMIEHRNIKLQFDCVDDLYGFFDRDLVAGVISNVINNLYKYTRNQMHLSATQENGYIVIRISDNGPGYPEDMLIGAADGQKELSFSNYNTGLGLYFSRMVAELHKNKNKQGFIQTSNEGIDGGGCFSLFLP